MSREIEGAAELLTGPETRVRKNRGFTLVELLVSMAVLVLVMVITVQIVGKATSITAASNKFFDTAAMARTVFDRLAEDFANASLTGGTTMLYYSGSPNPGRSPSEVEMDRKLNSTFGFVCKTRSRRMSTDTTNPSVQDVRGIVVAYKIRPTAVTPRYGTTVNVPLINRGDAEFTFKSTGNLGSNGKYSYNIWDMFGSNGSPSLPTDLIATTTDNNLLTWQGFGDGVLRLHVSFVLDDGRVVQTLRQPKRTDVTPNLPPLDVTYGGFQGQVNGGTGDALPIAFSAATSADTNKHYVTGLIVGIVLLDQTTVNLSVTRNATFADDLADALGRPVNDGETPLSIWQANLTKITSLPIRQQIRFYQRFYAVTP